MTNTTGTTHAPLTAPLAQPKRPRKTSALLLGTALGAIVGMGYGRGAYAQTFTIDSEETIQNGGETLDGGDTLAITSSGSLEIDTDQAPYAAVTGTGGGNTVTNAGRISVTTTGVGSFTTSYGDAYDGSGGQGVVLAGGNSRVTNDGQIVITSTDGEDNGFNSGVTLSDLDGAEVLNGGSISITASASSGTSYAAYNHAVYGYAPSNVNGVVIRNEGDIDIQVNGSGFDTGRNRAIRLVGAYNDTTGSYDGTFTNMTVANDGAIRITANDGGNRGVFISGNGDNIDLRNTGLIDIDAGVFGSNGAAGNRGFQFNGVDGYMRVENSGRIEISTNGGGNRGLFHDGVRDIYLINSGSIDIDIRDGTGGGNRGIQVSPQQGGTATVINSGSISIDTGSGGNRGVMLAFGYANSPYVLNSGRIVITGAAPKGVFAYGTGLDADYNVVGGEALVVNTGYIAINASAYGQGIELKDYSYEADTRVVNRGRIIVSGGSGTHGIEVVAGGDGNTATVTNSGTIISSYHSIELDNYSGAAGVINLEAGSVLVGDIEIANHDTATINFGPGLNAIVRMEDVTEGSDVPAQINVTDGEYVVEGDTIYVASNQSFAAVDTGRVIQNTGRVIQNVGSLTLDALAANTSGASFTPEVTRGSARVRNLGWGTFFGRRSDGDGVTRDVNTRGIMVGAELGETIGIFFGAANSTFGADSEANHRFAGVYANLAAGGFDIDTSLTFGQTDASSDGLVIADNRLMPGFSTTDVSAESTYVTPAITVAREFDVGSGTVTPSFRLSYTLIETETSSLSIGPLTLAEGAGREDHLYNARFQVERGLQEIILEDGLLSAKLRGGFDTSYMDASGSGRDWDSTRAFVGAEFTYSSEDGAVELSGGIELGRTSNEVTDARANLGFAVRF